MRVLASSSVAAFWQSLLIDNSRIERSQLETPKDFEIISKEIEAVVVPNTQALSYQPAELRQN
jgi:hypothetical protein